MISARFRPLASAVRMKSWFRTSSIEARVMRATKPTWMMARVRAGMMIVPAQPIGSSLKGHVAAGWKEAEFHGKQQDQHDRRARNRARTIRTERAVITT